MNASKKKIMEVAIQKQQQLIEDFRSRIRELMTVNGLGNEEQYDSQTQAKQHENSLEATRLNEQLRFANDELEALFRLANEVQFPTKIVAPGSLVITNKMIFFISVSIEHFDVDGQSIFGISSHSPLYKAMKGKSIGDTFQYGGNHYTILSIL